MQKADGCGLRLLCQSTARSVRYVLTKLDWSDTELDTLPLRKAEENEAEELAAEESEVC